MDYMNSQHTVFLWSIFLIAATLAQPGLTISRKRTRVKEHRKFLISPHGAEVEWALGVI
jgi:hypothetical protein